MQLTAKILALYFLLGSFFPRTDFSQIAALPDLYDHFQEHRKEVIAKGASLSFLDFLQQHFISPDGHAHQDNSHQDLPLSTVQTLFNFYFSDTFDWSDFTNSEFFDANLTWLDQFVFKDFTQSLLRPPIQI